MRRHGQFGTLVKPDKTQYPAITAVSRDANGAMSLKIMIQQLREKGVVTRGGK